MSTILSTLLKRSKVISGKLSRSTTTTTRNFHVSSTVLNVSNSVEGDPKPFVGAPYAYAYGRSQHELVYKSIGVILDERVAKESGRPMLISHHEGIKRTFTEFNEDVNRVAKAMYEDLGLKRGDVIGLWSCNTYDWITIQYAAARLGIILCTINPYYQAAELNYVLRKADIKTLFMPGQGSIQEQINRFQKILAEALKIGNEGSSDDKFQLENIVSIDAGIFSSNEIPSINDLSLRFHSLAKLKEHKNTDVSASLTSLVSPDDPGIIMFTSGTTGKPKGALLSQFTMLNNATLAGKSYTNVPPEKLSFCVPLPFFHSFACVLGCIAMAATPYQLVIPYMKHDISKIVESINAYQVTHITATPTLVIDLLNYLTHHKVAIPSLASLLAGGASVPIETAHQFMQAASNCTDFRIGYGATELGPGTTGCRPWYTFEQRTETIGTPLDFVEIKLTDPETKQMVKIGQAGEIHSRGHNTMLGYWKDPVKTREAIDHAGWYNTGDLGVMDSEGFLKIIGRTKELIIVGGENVYPREIEELLHTHPDILDAHVIGVPDPRKGEEVCAWIKLKESDAKVTEEELKKFCQDNLAYFKVPRYYMFVDGFPVTSVGKAKKFVMREITCKKLGLKENK